MIAINWKMGKSTANIKVESVQYIEEGDQAEIVLKPTFPLVVTRFDECESFGRIACLDNLDLAMLGKVVKVK